MSITKNTRLKTETFNHGWLFYYFINAQRRKRERKRRANAGGDTRKIKIKRKSAEGPTIPADLFLLFACWRFERLSQTKAKVNRLARNKTLRKVRRSSPQKRNSELVITCHFGRG